MKLGIALAGGGVKGAAHIAGTSSGSIVSALYACGYNADEIYHIFKKYCNKINYVSIKNILKLLLGLVLKRKVLIQGLNDGNEIEKLMKKFGGNKGISNINQLKMPIIIPSVDLHNGKVYVFSSNEKRGLYNDKIEYINEVFEEELKQDDYMNIIEVICSAIGILSHELSTYELIRR